MGCIIGCIALGFVAIYEYHVLGDVRPDGARNAARFGLMAIILLFLSIWLAITLWRGNIKYFIAIPIILILYAIALNQTRSAMLCAGIFILLVYSFFRNTLGREKIFISILVTIIVFILFVFLNPILRDRFMETILEAEAFFTDPVENYKTSFGLRPHMFYTGIQVFLQAPIFGTGLGEYANDVQHLMDQGKTIVKDKWLLTSPHNIYINMLAETGLVGFSGFILGVCAIPLYVYHKLSKSIQEPLHAYKRLFIYSGVTCVLCYLFFGMFHTWININNSISIFLLFQLVYLSNISILFKQVDL